MPLVQIVVVGDPPVWAASAVIGQVASRLPASKLHFCLYGDTACWGNTAALMCGYAFFGADHVLFATDMPFGSQGGEEFVRETIRSVEEMDITEEDRKKIFEDNARNLFRLPI